jgi:hypothetical protein
VVYDTLKVALGNKMTKKKQLRGFEAVAAKIAKQQGISPENAGAILASSSRNASKKAKKANPRLKRVK